MKKSRAKNDPLLELELVSTGVFKQVFLEYFRDPTTACSRFIFVSNVNGGQLRHSVPLLLPLRPPPMPMPIMGVLIRMGIVLLRAAAASAAPIFT